MAALKKSLKAALSKVRKLIKRDESAVEYLKRNDNYPSYLCDVCGKPISSHKDNHRCWDCHRSFNLCAACYRAGEAERHLEEKGPQHKIAPETEVCFKGHTIIKGDTLTETMLNMFKYYALRPSFGEYDDSTKDYRYIAFSELLSLVHQFYSGLDSLMSGLQLASQFVALCGSSSLRWFIADYACLFLGVPSVPIGVAVDARSMAFILNQTEAGVMVCDASMLGTVKASVLPKCPSLKLVIVMGDSGGLTEVIPQEGSQDVRVLPFEAVLKKGEENMISLPKSGLSEDDIFTIVYTSGSTGDPKGCVFTRDIYHQRATQKMSAGFGIGGLQVWFSFQPPSHLLERRSTHQILLKGGKVGVYRGTMDHIFEDIALVRPTIFAAAPRFYSIIYDQFQQTQKELVEKFKKEEEEEAALQGKKKVNEEKGTATGEEESKVQEEEEAVLKGKEKMEGQERGGEKEEKKEKNVSDCKEDEPRTEDSTIEKEQVSLVAPDILMAKESCIYLTPSEKAYLQAKHQYRHILGGRCLLLTTGGAATGKAVKTFLQDVVSMFVSDGYGTTEAGGVSFNDAIVAEDLKLVDVPEMGYLTTDDPPRGEVWVKNPNIIAGYYKNPQETADKFEDGYFRTGDIAERKGKLEVVLIDRKKNIFKLAQGEFVAPSHLETIFTDDSRYIEQMFIYGQGQWNNVVAVVVPFRSLTELWWSGQNEETPASYEEICKKDSFREFLLQEVRSISSKHNLPGWEIPIGVLVVSEQFTPENGLLTVSFKPCRPKLERLYKEQLESLYEATSLSGNTSVDVVEQFVNLVTACFQADSPDEETLPAVPSHFVTGTFAQLGCDSIAALGAVNTLKRRLGVEVPIERLVGCTVAQLVHCLCEDFDCKVLNAPLFESLRSKAGSDNNCKPAPILKYPEILYEDSDFDKWLKESGLVPNLQTESGSPNGPKTVLLTGSAGFLGRQILHFLLKSDQCGGLYCLLRRKANLKDGSDMKAYLWTILAASLEEKDDHFQSVFEERVTVVEGDLSKPLLGLEQATFQHLAHSVDLIIHNGALVNHVLPYANLRDTNVASTKELLRMCFTGKVKHFHFVSTAGVLSGGIGGGWSLDENCDISNFSVEKLIGYTQSKWVSERLLAQAVQKGLLRGCISRPGMIGPHSHSGEGNERDWVHALLSAVVEVGMVPKSAQASLHVVPVDHVAKGVVVLSLGSEGKGDVESGTGDGKINSGLNRCQVYHLLNSDQPLAYSTIFECLHAIRPQLQGTDYVRFRRTLAEMTRRLNSVTLTKANSLLPLKALEPPTTRPNMNAITTGALQSLMGPDSVCSYGGSGLENYFRTYLKRYFGEQPVVTKEEV